MDWSFCGAHYLAVTVCPIAHWNARSHPHLQSLLVAWSLPPPSDEDVASLLTRIAGRIGALIDNNDDDAGDDDDMQLWAQAEASQPPLFSIPLDADERKRRRSFVDGRCAVDRDSQQRRRQRLSKGVARSRPEPLSMNLLAELAWIAELQKRQDEHEAEVALRKVFLMGGAVS